MEEIDLIKRCQKGDRKAQQQLYGVYADKMYRVGYRYIKSSTDAEDVMMLSFTKVFNSMKGFRHQGAGSLEAWIRKIVVNESLMWLRTRHNFNLTESIDEAHTEPDLTQFGAAAAEDIYKMIGDLPTGYRTVFNLHAIEGFSHEEIGQLLGIQEGTSRSQLFKAKVILKKMLTREGFHYGT